MEAIEQAIIDGARAGRLRAHVRKNGEAGLAGLVRLADRHSALATAALNRVAGESGDYALPRLSRVGGVWREI